MATPVEQVLRYPFESFVDGSTLRLATQRRADSDDGYFFERALTKPRRSADQLRALMAVVQARHYLPPAILTRLREADPIVTASDDTLRFEGFSACCGVHARVDLLAGALGPGPAGRGTTNVDFNPPMLAALARLGASDHVTLAVGASEVALRAVTGDAVEKRVALPLRWLRGLVEVQTAQRRMEQVFSIEGTHAFRFLRSLPRATSRAATYVEPAGAGLRVSRTSRAGSINVGGLERLHPLESLAAGADRLLVFSDAATGASGWALVFDDSCITLTLSPGVWRGFSGEGQALTTVAAAGEASVSRVRAQLSWGNSVDPDEIAANTGMEQEAVHAALQVLGTQGLVGFDLVAQRYFHRELPFDLSAIEDLQPRLVAARKLVAADAVRIATVEPNYEVFVSSTDVEHRVAGSGEPVAWTCTCPWFAKHADRRGPCKHVLASQIATSS